MNTIRRFRDLTIFAQFRILEIERFCLLRAKIKYKRVKSCFVIVDFNLFFRTGILAFFVISFHRCFEVSDL